MQCKEKRPQKMKEEWWAHKIASGMRPLLLLDVK